MQQPVSDESTLQLLRAALTAARSPGAWKSFVGWPSIRLGLLVLAIACASVLWNHITLAAVLLGALACSVCTWTHLDRKDTIAELVSRLAELEAAAAPERLAPGRYAATAFALDGVQPVDTNCVVGYDVETRTHFFQSGYEADDGAPLVWYGRVFGEYPSYRELVRTLARRNVRLEVNVDAENSRDR